jgi:hypothetical protein
LKYSLLLLFVVVVSFFVSYCSDRADALREEDPLLQSIDWSIHSLSHGLGASDSRMEGGGVQAASTSIIANYFLKSHGGAHALQVACSFLATISGLGAIFLQKKQPIGFTCLQRCLLFAMVKHVSGLLAAASIAAKAIPKIGLSQARGWMEQLVLDPVSQYVCYTALILLWLPSKTRMIYAWWSNYPWVVPLLVGPILLREVISNLLVVSDILVLSSMNGEPSSTIQTVLNVSQSTINAFMSLLLSPQKWRDADPAKRQAILAKLVSQVSLFMEVAVGLLLSLDFGYAFFQMAFSAAGPKRPPLKETLVRLVCVRLYVHFLWIRRQPISKLGLQIRGGATQVPFWILDVVLEPRASMGLLPLSNNSNNKKKTEDPSSRTWKDDVFVALGIGHQ